MSKPRVFVSHSHHDNAFTERLVDDLKARGADVWVDYERIASGDFAASINEGLGTCEWVILVMTPNALDSQWVVNEINAAVNLHAKRKRIKGVIPVLAEDCSHRDVPPIWDMLHTYDATQDYDRALKGLARALDLAAFEAGRSDQVPNVSLPHVPGPGSYPHNDSAGSELGVFDEAILAAFRDVARSRLTEDAVGSSTPLDQGDKSEPSGEEVTEDPWSRIERAFASQEFLTGLVLQTVKGGLVVDVGVGGFVPATHVGSGRLRDLEKFVGQTLELKVLEFDRERRKVVLSNREAESARRELVSQEFFRMVKPGDRLTGRVRRVTDYGAFLDLGGVDGLLHMADMSWARLEHPSELVQEGQEVEVVVLRIDRESGKVSLSRREALPDPWITIAKNYQVGQVIKVKIGRMLQSGVFVRLPEGAEAFLPVAEMSFKRIKHPQDVVQPGQEVDANIIDFRPEDRAMVLSMRSLLSSKG